uniref:AB hydrolase-1 domain-containing protein n=1 Tax=Globodera pallida TaxID=36090 RepID=A0A183CKH0_GLOPA
MPCGPWLLVMCLVYLIAYFIYRMADPTTSAAVPAAIPAAVSTPVPAAVAAAFSGAPGHPQALAVSPPRVDNDARTGALEGKSTAKMGDGDTLVNIESLRVCQKWMDEGKLVKKVVEIDGPTHMAILHEDKFYKAVETIMGDSRFQACLLHMLSLHYDPATKVFSNQPNVNVTFLGDKPFGSVWPTMFCVHSNIADGVPIFYNYTKGIGKSPKAKMGDGDSLVNIESLRVCQKWMDEGKLVKKVVEIDGPTHMAILHEDKFYKAVETVMGL